MQKENGEIQEERRVPEHPQPDGKRWYDPPRAQWPKIPIQRILLWITFAGVMISLLDKGVDYLAKRANIGMAAEIAKLHERMDEQAKRDSIAQAERMNLLKVQTKQAAELDTVKQGITLFAEQICSKQRETLSLITQRRCRILFNGNPP